MPIYLIRCPHCEAQREVYRSFREMDDLPECCGVPMERVICPSMVMADIQPYQSMITGEYITSRSRHRDHLRAHNCIEVGNEKLPTPGPLKSPPGLKEELVKVVNQKTGG